MNTTTATPHMLSALTLCAALAAAAPAGAQAPPAPKAPGQSAPPASASAPAAAPTNAPFTLAQATAGLVGKGPLVAAMELQTKGQPLGTLHCDLWPDKAPLLVANFIGLARGLRSFKDPRKGEWVKRPLYDGMYLHRLVPGYIIQAGDPQCQGDPACGGRPGAGEPGYLIPDELDPAQRLDQGGVLAMANRDLNENGSQFFITVAAAGHLQGRQSVLGRCAEVDLVARISQLERTPRDMPVEPILIKKVTISRKAR